MRKSDLNEGYAIVIHQRWEKVLLFVCGKQVSPHVALTYNHLKDCYSYTFIGSGMSIGTKTYTTLAAAQRDYKTTVEQFEQELRNGKLMAHVTLAKQSYNNLIFHKKFYCEFI